MENQATLQLQSTTGTEPLHQADAALGLAPVVRQRPRVAGKFLFVGAEKLWIRGVTYGTFRPDANGLQFPEPRQVAQDFAQMASHGVNAVRTYTVPPRWLLDIALENGLHVMVGIPWEQHIAFLNEKRRTRSIEDVTRSAARACAGHPAVLCFAVGNEIPASIVRWHGRRRIEQFIERLYRIVKQQDPEALVTYVNFPTTEYLQLPFLDFLCFNVYLESQQSLEAYLARLQNLADERPVLMAEIGLDSRRNGEQSQADSLRWQIQSVFKSGCVGTFVFAWTDEWYRGGYDIEDWDFGLTTRQRQPKPALVSVAKAFADAPFPVDTAWPAISVVVCSYNGARTIRDTLEGLKRLSYPDYEVIVVNDGSTDDTPAIAAEYDVKLISTENRGLSNARNTGYQAARGEIVAYIDDDAYPDPDWAHYLALTYLGSDCAGVGGPNLAPPGDGSIADCVAHAPGGPVHVLLSDTIAEHIPGCNMSFKKSALEAVGGFDPRYRAAGDDVDVCWRIQDQVGTIAFHPAAMVWHHRRNCIRMYWKQQQGYGKAEALLEEKWPERYNVFGHTSWGGRLYGKGFTLNLAALRSHVYQGVWGSAPFQSLYQSAPTTLSSLPLMPEWYLLLPPLLLLSLLGLAWDPLLYVVPALLLAVVLPVLQAVLSARRARFTSKPETRWQRYKLFWITAFMHLQQPLARLIGRLRHGLSPWRRAAAGTPRLPTCRRLASWHERWEAPSDILEKLRNACSESGMVVTTGGNYDAWDLELRGGLFGSARLLMATEEHGGGRQMMRFRVWPKWSRFALLPAVLFAGISIFSAADDAWLVSTLCAVVFVLIVARALLESGAAIGALCDHLQKLSTL
ncbi:MAG: glycosyltransferase [Gammaproteobacteria bacterium]|nr:MAG: glycosyltransferase [Gammaproteobacteria bacterium]